MLEVKDPRQERLIVPRLLANAFSYSVAVGKLLVQMMKSSIMTFTYSTQVHLQAAFLVFIDIDSERDSVSCFFFGRIVTELELILFRDSNVATSCNGWESTLCTR